MTPDDAWDSVSDSPSGANFFRFSDIPAEGGEFVWLEEPHGKPFRSTLPTTILEGRATWNGVEVLVSLTANQATSFKPHRPLKGKRLNASRPGGRLVVVPWPAEEPDEEDEADAQARAAEMRPTRKGKLI